MANVSDVSASTTQPGMPAAGLVDLEKELSCSICTEVLYQPLTLLDCLHTFCGSCLKEWFGWQRQRADQEYERAHRSRNRRRRKQYVYTCPSCRAVVREARPNANVTTLLDMFLSANPARQKPPAEKQEIAKTYKPGDAVLLQVTEAEPNASTESASSGDEDDQQLLQQVQAMSLHDLSAQRQGANGRRGRRHHERVGSNTARPHEDRRRNGGHGRSTSRQVQLGHQSSLRSLLNPHDSEEMKEEIMRQIAEEGLLDDIDWDNIQVEQEDEISERIAEAYKRRRRQQSRTRAESRQREGRDREAARPGSAQGQTRHARASSATGQSSNPAASRPPVSRPHLFNANPPESHRHRRSSSQGRLPSTTQSSSSSNVQQAAARSATDLSDRPRSRDPRYERPSRRSNEGRRTTDPDSVPVSEQWRSGVAAPTSVQRVRPERRRLSQPTSAPPTRTSFETSPAPEPVAAPSISVSCDRCDRHNIEHTLHYTCTRCGPPGSTYDLCLRCYRLGRGCLHWFGFGHAAWQRWERRAPPGSESPHVLRSQKYLTRQDTGPQNQSNEPLLQLGVFCDVCHENANACYWHCPQCNEGEWGYCHRCVNQARHCIHPLLPMTLQSPTPTTTPATPPANDTSPHSTTLAPEAQLTPLVLPTTCNVCHASIPTTAQRLHCPDCATGDYDLCLPCYDRLNPPPTTTPRVGSRKCPQGHRLLLVDFAITNGAKDFAWRRVLEGHSGAWVPEGLVPPADGNPGRAEAIWPWIPEEGVKDEIGFPRGAVLEDVVGVNEEFSWGVYCRRGGYFPTAYVRVV